MKYINGWEEDRWKVTRAGDWKKFYAKHENGNKIWINDPGGRGDNYGVKMGTSTRRLRDSCYITTGLPNEAAAEGIVQQVIANEDDPECPVYGYE